LIFVFPDKRKKHWLLNLKSHDLCLAELYYRYRRLSRKRLNLPNGRKKYF